MTEKSLLEDPSIVQISTPNSNNDTNSGATFHTASTSSIHNLEPGNALSKLLDSAMAKAAKESTPDLVPRSRSVSPIPAVTSKPGIPYVYSIEFLLSLKLSPDIPDYKDSPELPDKS